MMPPSTKKKKKVKCPNPLFVRWLSEWQEEAFKKGLKSHHTYGKALGALQKYPLPLSSGKECKILENFGDKICAMLDLKLSQHKSEHGGTIPPLSSSEDDSDDDETDAYNGGKFVATKSKRTKRSSTDETQKPRRATGKEYIPAYQSGPYAIILILYEQQKKFDVERMSKKDLMKAAQPLAAKSFTVPDPGCRYTAWSSMGSLIKKGLVCRESSPAKYFLTQAGRNLAKKMCSGTVYGSCPNAAEELQLIPEVTAATQITEESAKGRKKEKRRVDGDGDNIAGRYRGAISLSSDESENELNQAPHVRCATIVNKAGQKSSPSSSPTLLVSSSIATSNRILISESSSLVAPSVKSSSAKSSTSVGPNDDDIVGPLTERIGAKKREFIFPRNTAVESSNSQLSTASRGTDDDRDSQAKLEDSQFVLVPGTFDIVLCVDSCELRGGAQGNTRELMLMELKRCGMKFDVRKLCVGDFLWIAKSKTVPEQELVLDYIVERKRMDDLAGSIVDGRFHEQKFRLSNCGLQNAFYLVENYGTSHQHFSISEDALNQAIVNTQVIDRFTVKRTKDVAESAAYLAMFTKHLQRRYQDKVLYACNLACKRTTSNGQSISLDAQEEILLPTFEEFNSSSIKNREFTVREMFGKHLVQLRGITVEKVAAILDSYPTPASLFEAYACCSDQNSRENLLSGLKAGPSKRNLGTALSNQVCTLYCHK